MFIPGKTASANTIPVRTTRLLYTYVLCTSDESRYTAVQYSSIGVPMHMHSTRNHQEQASKKFIPSLTRSAVISAVHLHTTALRGADAFVPPTGGFAKTRSSAVYVSSTSTSSRRGYSGVDVRVRAVERSARPRRTGRYQQGQGGALMAQMTDEEMALDQVKVQGSMVK